MTVEELKHALINFNSIMEWWEVNQMGVEAIIYEMEGVKGIRFDREPTQKADTNVDKRMLHLIEKKDELIIANKYYENTVNEVHNFIEWLEEPFKQMVIDKHLNEYSNTKMTRLYCYSQSHIYYLIDRLIEKYIKKQET